MNAKAEGFTALDAVPGHAYPINRFEVHYWNPDTTPAKWSVLRRNFKYVEDARAFVAAYPARMEKAGMGWLGEAATKIRIVHITGTGTVTE